LKLHSHQKIKKTAINMLERNEEYNSIQDSLKNKERKYIGINLTKEVNDFYSKNYKTLKKEIEEGTRR
jgi:type III secretory pathway component EscV